VTNAQKARFHARGLAHVAEGHPRCRQEHSCFRQERGPGFGERHLTGTAHEQDDVKLGLESTH
jgi:hypothetical protein